MPDPLCPAPEPPITRGSADSPVESSSPPREDSVMARLFLRALVVVLALASAGAFTVSAVRTIHGRRRR